MLVFRQHLRRLRNLTPCIDFTLMGINAMEHAYDIVRGDVTEDIESDNIKLQKKVNRSFRVEVF